MSIRCSLETDVQVFSRAYKDGLTELVSTAAPETIGSGRGMSFHGVFILPDREVGAKGFKPFAPALIRVNAPCRPRQ